MNNVPCLFTETKYRNTTFSNQTKCPIEDWLSADYGTYTRDVQWSLWHGRIFTRHYRYHWQTSLILMNDSAFYDSPSGCDISLPNAMKQVVSCPLLLSYHTHSILLIIIAVISWKVYFIHSRCQSVKTYNISRTFHTCIDSYPLVRYICVAVLNHHWIR